MVTGSLEKNEKMDHQKPRSVANLCAPVLHYPDNFGVNEMAANYKKSVTVFFVLFVQASGAIERNV